MIVSTVNQGKIPGPTEHIIQLAISIDDGKIIAGVEEAAKKQILTDLSDAIQKAIFVERWGGGVTTEPREWCQLKFNAFLEEHKAEIIGAAAKQLADKLVRSKAGKALLDQK